MAKFIIEAITEKCTGCLRCQLACSELHTKVFNPLAARIKVIMRGAECDISFTADCKRCGICMDNCYYGALIKKQMEDPI